MNIQDSDIEMAFDYGSNSDIESNPWLSPLSEHGSHCSNLLHSNSPRSSADNNDHASQSDNNPVDYDYGFNYLDNPWLHHDPLLSDSRHSAPEAQLPNPTDNDAGLLSPGHEDTPSLRGFDCGHEGVHFEGSENGESRLGGNVHMEEGVEDEDGEANACDGEDKGQDEDESRTNAPMLIRTKHLFINGMQ